MSFQPKYFVHSSLGLDAFEKLENYTAQCHDKYAAFAKEISRVSNALSALQNTVPLTAAQQENLLSNGALEDVTFEDYQRKAVEGFIDRTQHYTEDAVFSMNYFAESLPHHVKKIDGLFAKREKSYRSLKRKSLPQRSTLQRQQKEKIDADTVQKTFVRDHLALMNAYREIHFRREFIMLHHTRLYTSQQRNLSGLLRNLSRKMRKTLKQRGLSASSTPRATRRSLLPRRLSIE